jgi:hypothetical protein
MAFSGSGVEVGGAEVSVGLSVGNVEVGSASEGRIVGMEVVSPLQADNNQATIRMSRSECLIMVFIG